MLLPRVQKSCKQAMYYCAVLSWHVFDSHEASRSSQALAKWHCIAAASTLGDQTEAFKALEETLLCRLVLTKSTWQARQQTQASQGFLAATTSPVYAFTWQLQQAPVLHHMHYTHGDGGLWPLQTRLQDASIAVVGTQPHLWGEWPPASAGTSLAWQATPVAQAPVQWPAGQAPPLGLPSAGVHP